MTVEEIRNIKINDRVKKIGSETYHYTSLTAFNSIIKTKELWLGTTEEMNDKNELLCFSETIYNTLKKDLPDKKDKIDIFFKKVNQKITQKHHFLMSFTTKKTSKYHWKHYGNNGVCLEFDTKTLLTLIDTLGMTFNKVFYQKTKFSFRIKKHKHYKILRKYFANGVLTEFENEDGLISNFILVASKHKKCKFFREREYRLEPLFENVGGHTKYTKVEFDNLTNRTFLKIDINALCIDNNIKLEQLIKNVYILYSIPNKEELIKLCIENKLKYHIIK